MNTSLSISSRSAIVRRAVLGALIAVAFALFFSPKARTIALVAVASGVAFATVPLVLEQGGGRRLPPAR